jgi:hypothetical protein
MEAMRSAATAQEGLSVRSLKFNKLIPGERAIKERERKARPAWKVSHSGKQQGALTRSGNEVGPRVLEAQIDKLAAANRHLQSV